MGINIDEINWTEIILVAIYITYSVVYWWPLPNICPVSLPRKLNEDNKKRVLFEERSSIGFLSTPRSRTSYYDSTDWVLYRINLIIWEPVEFQQKNNLALNDQFDPQIALTFGACTWYDKWYLYCLVSFFLLCK